MTDPPAPDVEFDFKDHVLRAAEGYRQLLPAFHDCAENIRDILSRSLDAKGIKVHSIEPRAKSLDSFSHKAGEPSDSDQTKPKYRNLSLILRILPAFA
jgi:hypothetical protein